MTRPPDALDRVETWSDVLDSSLFLDAFERRPFVVRHAYGEPADVITVADLEYLLIEPPGASSSDTRLSKVCPGGRVDAIALRPDFKLTEVLQRYRDGYSVALDQANYRWPALYVMCAALQRTLARVAPVTTRCRATCSVFLTPPRAQGTPRHYDRNDGYALQLEGRKTWRLWAPVREAPLANSSDDAVDLTQLGAPQLEVTLEPGDLLYFPRGFIHENVTGSGHSLHVSFGVIPLTWNQVFTELVSERPEWRRSVPKAFLSVAGGGEPSLRATFSAMVAALDDPVEIRKRATLAATTYLVTESQTAAGLIAEAAAEEHGPQLIAEGTFEKRYGARHQVHGAGGELLIAFPGSTARVSRSHAAALDRILAANRVTTSELAAEIGTDDAQDLLARLTRCGFLRKVAATDGRA